MKERIEERTANLFQRDQQLRAQHRGSGCRNLAEQGEDILSQRAHHKRCFGLTGGGS